MRHPMSDPDHFIARVPGIQYGVLDTLLGYAVRRAQIRMYETFIAALEPWRITPPRFSALVIVSLNPGLKLTQLARIMGIARSGAVILVDALEEMGYMARMPVPEDRRAFSLVLTDKGEADLQAITQAVVKQDQEATRMLASADQATLREMLLRISDAAAA
jgi:DNA-binding MarR family transcriptional regulator